MPPPGAAVPPPGAASPPPFGAAPTGAAGPTPEQQAELKAANRNPSIFAIVGGLLLVIGSFLPWASIDTADLGGPISLESETATGWNTLDGDIGDGPFFLIPGLAIAVMGGLGLAGTTNLGTKVATIALGVIAILLTFVEFASISSDLDDIETLLGIGGSLGFGLFVLAIGAIASLVAGILMKRSL